MRVQLEGWGGAAAPPAKSRDVGGQTDLPGAREELAVVDGEGSRGAGGRSSRVGLQCHLRGCREGRAGVGGAELGIGVGGPTPSPIIGLRLFSWCSCGDALGWSLAWAGKERASGEMRQPGHVVPEYSGLFD